MNLFLDSSALVKLYVEEPDSALVRAWVDGADVVSACRIAWAEIQAALAARERLGTVASGADVIQALRLDWPRFAKVEITQPLVERAGEFAHAFALRGYDSVQLAAVDLLHRAERQPVAFGCFDRRLARAPGILGIAVPPIPERGSAARAMDEGPTPPGSS